MQDSLEHQTLLSSIKAIHTELDTELLRKYNRSLPFNECLGDRWARAQKLGFGEGTSIYDSALVFLPVQIGKHCWIGPFTIIDGSGGLEIGDSCTISSGVQIYTHDNVKQTLQGREFTTPIDRAPVAIGHNTYIAPNVVVSKGVKIGNYCVIATNSYVHKDIPDYSIVAGTPAKPIGTVELLNNTINFIYFK